MVRIGSGIDIDPQALERILASAGLKPGRAAVVGHHGDVAEALLGLLRAPAGRAAYEGVVGWTPTAGAGLRPTERGQSEPTGGDDGGEDDGGASCDADPTPGWWEDMVGIEHPIDTERYFVICVNSLGSCQGSTGPGCVNPKTGVQYRLSFPDLVIGDIARAAQLGPNHSPMCASPRPRDSVMPAPPTPFTATTPSATGTVKPPPEWPRRTA